MKSSPSRKIAGALLLSAFVASFGLAAERPDSFTAYLDRSYYTTEKEAGVVCEVPRTGTDLAVTIHDAQGKALGASPVDQQRMRIAVPCAALVTGTHALTVELRGTGAAPLSRSLELIKREPKPGFEWKIDQVN